VYVCTADNGAGSKSRDFDVDIHCTSSGHFTVQKLQSFSYCIFSRIYAVLVKWIKVFILVIFCEPFTLLGAYWRNMLDSGPRCFRVCHYVQLSYSSTSEAASAPSRRLIYDSLCRSLQFAEVCLIFIKNWCYYIIATDSCGVLAWFIVCRSFPVENISSSISVSHPTLFYAVACVFFFHYHHHHLRVFSTFWHTQLTTVRDVKQLE